MTTTTTPPARQPLTASQRVSRANQALIERGGRRMPGGYMQPETAQALQELVSTGYAASPLAAIVAALHAAHKTHTQGLTPKK